MAELEQLRSAFSQDQNLCNRVLAAAQQSREQLQLSLDIARYFTRGAVTNGTNDTSASKKRKLDADPDTTTSLDLSSCTTLLSLPDTSFTIPIRKKASLDILASNPTSPSTAPGGLRITSKDITYTITWPQIAHIFCVPVPEKAAKTHNFVILLLSPASGETQFVFSLPETKYTGTSDLAGENDTWVSLAGRTLNAYLAPHGRGVTLPDEEQFASAVPQSHRKGEAAYHVKAHLGSKEGYLFFLGTGVLFGFKKPVMFFPFERVESTSYTSVLQRTFNLVVTAVKEDGERDEVEFGMIDQADFAGIDAYVKGHGLNDASMAEQRMAKRIGVNDPRRRKGEKDGEGAEVVQNGEEESELVKAERQLQDEEDEEEEDYDPGSEGESEGEGSESEEEGDDGPVEEVEGEEEDEE
ncbi:hypothetical protein B9Z65_54 [Elsinoe australis]|uniref:Histone chaperone RTT106/FACT complex subunit SPT16-like middle domain-containing protein n=1 Tax=Elsinoe australis TaxID=40998 RepID=A0A2P7ZKA6_9PEZI|nr:hypothetical protein B9Z65_54 [Elsinoe australis]